VCAGKTLAHDERATAHVVSTPAVLRGLRREARFPARAGVAAAAGALEPPALESEVGRLDERIRVVRHPTVEQGIDEDLAV
jgi:hypothetical protein